MTNNQRTSGQQLREHLEKATTVISLEKRRWDVTKDTDKVEPPSGIMLVTCEQSKKDTSVPSDPVPPFN